MPLFALLLTFLLPLAQASSDFQSWTQLFIQKKVTEDYFLYLETQPRMTHNLTQLNRVLIRPAFAYQISPSSTVWLGYLWSAAIQSGAQSEHRLWQQLLYQSEYSLWTLLSRTRLEQRWIQNAGSGALRIRQMFRVLFPLDQDRTWSLAAWDEVFIHLTSVSHGPQSGYDQNRLFFGVSRLFNKNVRIEPGYMLNHVHRPTEDQLNHIFYVMVAWLL